MVTISRTMLMYYDLRCAEETLFNDIWPMVMDYNVWVYNMFPGMQSGLSTIVIWSRSRFELVS